MALKDKTDVKDNTTQGQRDFLLFQKTFKEYQQKFGLTGYKVYFKYEPLEKAYASIMCEQGDLVATVRLNSELPEKHKLHKDIKGSAKHEALHLLLMRLEILAKYRYANSDEIYEAAEELVHKLEELIK